MKKVEGACTCPPRDWGGEYWRQEPPCDACSEWYAAEIVLSKELALRQWDFPAVLNPDAQRLYPAGCYAAERWHRDKDEDAIARYRAMEEASRGYKAAPPRQGNAVVGDGTGSLPALTGG